MVKPYEINVNDLRPILTKSNGSRFKNNDFLLENTNWRPHKRILIDLNVQFTTFKKA